MHKKIQAKAYKRLWESLVVAQLDYFAARELSVSGSPNHCFAKFASANGGAVCYQHVRCLLEKQIAIIVGLANPALRREKSLPLFYLTHQIEPRKT